MRKDRLQEFARRAQGRTAYQRYKNLIEELDYSSRRGVEKMFGEYVDMGCTDEQAAERTFEDIEQL